MEGGEVFHSSLIANCTFNAVSSFTAIVFNIITIHAIRKTSTLPKTLKTLLLSLAVSDLGVGLIVQPLKVASIVMELKENTRNSAYVVTSKAYLTSVHFFALASFFGVVALSADRFLAIHLHLRYQELVTHKRVITAVVSVCLFCIFISLARQYKWIPGNIVFVIIAIICVACLVTLAFLNYNIFAAVRRHQHQIQTLQVHQTAQNIEMANVGRVRKSAVTALYIYLVFLVCYLPIICILVVTALTTYRPLAYDVIIDYCATLVFVNSSLNPLIYCWRMRDIRHSVMGILRNVVASRS